MAETVEVEEEVLPDSYYVEQLREAILPHLGTPSEIHSFDIHYGVAFAGITVFLEGRVTCVRVNQVKKAIEARHLDGLAQGVLEAHLRSKTLLQGNPTREMYERVQVLREFKYLLETVLKKACDQVDRYEFQRISSRIARELREKIPEDSVSKRERAKVEDKFVAAEYKCMVNSLLGVIEENFKLNEDRGLEDWVKEGDTGKRKKGQPRKKKGMKRMAQPGSATGS